MAWRVLVAEDEKRLRDIIRDYFESRGDVVVTAENGAVALELASDGFFDAVLLDIMMPELNGLTVCRELRKDGDIPIIFLTALSDEDDKLTGYELGADDYITKPFSLSVLYAKTSALIKRSRGELTGTLHVGSIEIDTTRREVLAEGKPVKLEPRQYELLLCLMRNKGLVMSREQLIVNCWGWDYEGSDRAVDTHIRRLRAALGGAARQISTVPKAGYRMEA